MHRALSLIFISLIISLSLIAESVEANQVVCLSFDNTRPYPFARDVSVRTAYAVYGTWGIDTTLSLPNQVYIAGFVLKTRSEFPRTYTIYIEYSDGTNTYTTQTITQRVGTSPVIFSFKAPTPLLTNNIRIRVWVKSDTHSSDPSYDEFFIDAGVVWVSESDVSILSNVYEQKYLPPGADDTAQGFLLNQTEISLSQTYTLSEGALSFWLKWDGSTKITISDNIGIDTNGYLYVKNDQGTTYTLQGVTPPVGQYVPVYVGWKAGGGYIMINTMKVTLNWDGNLIISKIGDIGQSSATIIDEFKLWDTYIPPDQILYEVLKEQYTLLYNGTAIAIKPEGGTSLGMIDVAFLDSNYTVLDSATLSPGQKTATVPDGTKIVVLTRGSVSRTYLLDENYTEIAFPAEGNTVIVSRISVRPEVWDYLTVKTVSGQVATRVKLENNEATFTAMYGNQYLFVFERAVETRTRIYTVSESNIVFYITKQDVEFKPPVDVKAYLENSTIVVSYYDENMSTTALNVTVAGYVDYKKVWEVYDYQPKQFGLYTLKVEANNTEYAVVTLKANVSGQIQEFKRTVYVEGGTSRSPFPEELIPPALLVLGFSLVPMFLYRAIEVHIMLISGAIGLSVGTVLGWIPAVPGLIAILTVLGIVAMIVYRGD